MLSAIFANYGTVSRLQEENKKAEARIKSLEKSLEDAKRQLEVNVRKYDYDTQDLRTHLERRAAVLQTELVNAREDAKRAEERAGAISERNEAEVDEELARLDSIVEDRVAEKVATERTKIRAEFEKKIDELKDAAADAEVETAAAVATSEEKENTIVSLTKQVEQYGEFVKFVMTKLPTVDLSKFNINVEVPAAEVTVVGGNQGGKKS